MYRLYGFTTQNTMKPLYALEEIGADFEFQFVDLTQGEQTTEEFRKKTPIGKVPLLEHEGEYLFESGAICRYVANVENSPLYPQNKIERAKVDQWLDFFVCHLGRWLVTLYWQQVLKPSLGLGETDQAACEEAVTFAHKQFELLDSLLATSDWLANDSLSIADMCAFAYVEQCGPVEFPMDDYPNVKAWFDRIENLDSVARARARLPS